MPPRRYAFCLFAFLVSFFFYYRFLERGAQCQSMSKSDLEAVAEQEAVELSLPVCPHSVIKEGHVCLSTRSSVDDQLVVHGLHSCMGQSACPAIPDMGSVSRQCTA
ncbi:hypothetical protein GE09DRAFT_253348 [Coniochaeta sp. 2T2.1]|nr:hypothetical protein GE09DRAFT_253348 [Coniochaeta sp. 2T2.1]